MAFCSIHLGWFGLPGPSSTFPSGGLQEANGEIFQGVLSPSFRLILLENILNVLSAAFPLPGTPFPLACLENSRL